MLLALLLLLRLGLLLLRLLFRPLLLPLPSSLREVIERAMRQDLSHPLGWAELPGRQPA